MSTVIAVLAFSETGWFSGWFVPDGITMFYSAIDSRGLSFGEIAEIFQAAAGLAVTMSFLVSIHPLAPALFNLLALMATCAMQPQGRGFLNAFLLVACPYFLLSASLPSKDIVVLLMYSVILRMIWTGPPQRLFVLAAPASGAIFLVRDGFAIMLAVAILAIALRELLRMPLVVFGAVLASSCAVFWTVSEGLFEGSFLIARALAVAEQGSTLDPASITTAQGYLVRLVGNATNLAFRPAVLDVNGQFNLLNGAYWASGVTLLVTLGASVRALRSKQAHDLRLGLLVLSLLLMVSVTPYVQPRYLLPLVVTLPLFSFVDTGYLLERWLIAALVSLAAAVAYGLAGTLPPPPEVQPFDVRLLLD
jgi:hypothetical protein